MISALANNNESGRIRGNIGNNFLLGDLQQVLGIGVFNSRNYGEQIVNAVLKASGGATQWRRYQAAVLFIAALTPGLNWADIMAHISVGQLNQQQISALIGPKIANSDEAAALRNIEVELNQLATLANQDDAEDNSSDGKINRVIMYRLFRALLQNSSQQMRMLLELIALPGVMLQKDVLQSAKPATRKLVISDTVKALSSTQGIRTSWIKKVVEPLASAYPEISKFVSAGIASGAQQIQNSTIAQALGSAYQTIVPLVTGSNSTSVSLNFVSKGMKSLASALAYVSSEAAAQDASSLSNAMDQNLGIESNISLDEAVSKVSTVLGNAAGSFLARMQSVTYGFTSTRLFPEGLVELPSRIRQAIQNSNLPPSYYIKFAGADSAGSAESVRAAKGLAAALKFAEYSNDAEAQSYAQNVITVSRGILRQQQDPAETTTAPDPFEAGATGNQGTPFQGGPSLPGSGPSTGGFSGGGYNSFYPGSASNEGGFTTFKRTLLDPDALADQYKGRGSGTPGETGGNPILRLLQARGVDLDIEGRHHIDARQVDPAQEVLSGVGHMDASNRLVAYPSHFATPRPEGRGLVGHRDIIRAHDNHRLAEMERNFMRRKAQRYARKRTAATALDHETSAYRSGQFIDRRVRRRFQIPVQRQPFVDTESVHRAKPERVRNVQSLFFS